MEKNNINYDKKFFQKIMGNQLFEDLIKHYSSIKTYFDSIDFDKDIEENHDKFKNIYDKLSLITVDGKNLAEELEVVLRQIVKHESNPIIKIYLDHEIDTRLGRNSDGSKISDYVAPKLIEYYGMEVLGSYDEKEIIEKYSEKNYNDVVYFLKDVLFSTAVNMGKRKSDTIPDKDITEDEDFISLLNDEEIKNLCQSLFQKLRSSIRQYSDVEEQMRRVSEAQKDKNDKIR